MRLILNDKDLITDFSNKNAEDLNLSDFFSQNDRNFYETRIIPVCHIVKYQGEKGEKIFKKIGHGY
jgi:hypothetical protein